VTEAPHIRLEPWTGSWEEHDPDANFKREVARLAPVDPLPTLERLSAQLGIPVGALARYVLARWVSAGSEALLELGPTWVRRLARPVADAEREATDEARVAAYHELRALLGWLEAGLDSPEWR
jgi:hypothetical protein